MRFRDEGIRAAEVGDLERLHAINRAAVPGVGPVSRDELARLMAISPLTLVALSNDAVAGFLLCLTEGADYSSRNYKWISERYQAFAYCDRIAIAPEARGLGLGERLYRSVWQWFAGKRSVLLCEVNLEPANPGSLRFHERLGFTAVGEGWTEDRSYGVVYLERSIHRLD